MITTIELINVVVRTLSNFQVYSEVLLPIIATLHIRSLELTCIARDILPLGLKGLGLLCLTLSTLCSDLAFSDPYLKLQTSPLALPSPLNLLYFFFLS